MVRSQNRQLVLDSEDDLAYSENDTVADHRGICRGTGRRVVLVGLLLLGVFLAAFAGASLGQRARPFPQSPPDSNTEFHSSSSRPATDAGGMPSDDGLAAVQRDPFGPAFQDATDGRTSPVLGLAGEGRCQSYGCDRGYVRGHSCQCTARCAGYGNCCADYESTCANRPTPPPTPAPPYGVFNCESNLDFGAVAQPERKGIAIDDTTFEQCADQVPMHWPNTNQTVHSVRLFKPWGSTLPKFFRGDRHAAWKGLKGFADATGAKFLLGVSVTCREADDDREWEYGKEFINYIGADRIMGIAVGNELDLQVGGSNGWCVSKLWNSGGYLRIFHQRVAEFDALPGMQGRTLPVTAVLSMFSMNGYPFKWTVNSFLKSVWKEYGDRFKFSINVYPQFSAGLAQAGSSKSIDIGTKFSAGTPTGFIPAVIQDIKKRLAKLGAGGMKIWLGEHGWATHAYCVLSHEACTSHRVQKEYYSNFLKWDLSTGDVPSACGPPHGSCAASIQWARTDGLSNHPDWYPGLTVASTDHDFQVFMAGKSTAESRGGCQFPCDAPEASAEPKQAPLDVDHAFYFTLRDSQVFGKSEAFGILNHCGSRQCKFQQ